ncbi:ABC transporter ATPase [Corynebacterium suranareeae]|uniref:ABC transporter ATPase n=1 Tax=Corynebacterium suranareeae TaxID=2506452 RepID=A0A161JPA6_9CORY|nr:AAA family ATPase [Corynebacterium suranareeae]BAU97176.1 ABC transporter ATPase [Corynebacterium suranareeae]
MLPFITDIAALEYGGVAASWTQDVPAFQVLREKRVLDFRAPITVITGENGVGKSTLLEAIAVNAGFQATGGAYTGKFNPYENPLQTVAKAHTGKEPMKGYFLRAETYYNVAGRQGNEAPGWVNLHHMSHGESVMHIVQHAFVGKGLYLMDEPEAGLSFIRQMAILAELSLLAQNGSQIIIVTHSPVLMAIPGAEIWEFNTSGELHRGFELEATTGFRALRDFFEDPEGIAEYMVDVTRES